MSDFTAFFTSVISQAQYASLLNRLDVQWPAEFERFMNLLSAINIDPLWVMRQATSDFPPVTFHMIFVVIVCLVPLSIDAALLVLFRPWYVVLWYFALVGGAMAVTVGLVGKFTATGNQIAAVAGSSQSLITIGASVCGGCLLLLLIRYIHFKLTKRKRADDDDEVGEDEFNYGLRFHRRRAITQVIVAIVCIIGGLILLRVIVISPPNMTSSDEALNGPVPTVFGAILVSIGGLAVLFFLMHLCERGRRITAYLQAFLDRNLLLILITLAGVSFMPVLSQCMDAVLCTEYQCPQGYRFNPFIPEPLRRLTPDDYASYCELCDFNDTMTADNTTCGLANATDLCPEWTGHRLWRHLDTECKDEANTYFIVTAALVGIAYAVGIPFLIYNVVERVTAFVWRYAKLIDVEGEDSDSRWGRKMDCIDPSVSGLYRPLRWVRRQYTVVDYITRIVFVIAAHVIAPLYPATAGYVIVGLHAALFLVLLIYRPYRRTILAVIVLAMTLCNVFTAVLAILLANGTIVPNSTQATQLGLAVLILDSAVPVIGTVALTYAMLRAWRETKDDESRLAQEEDAAEARSNYLQAAIAAARERQDRDALAAAELDLERGTTIGSSEGDWTSPPASPLPAAGLAPQQRSGDSAATPPAGATTPVITAKGANPLPPTQTGDPTNASIVSSPDLGATLSATMRHEAMVRAGEDPDAIATAEATKRAREPFEKVAVPLTRAQTQQRLRERKNRLRTYLVEGRAALLLNNAFMVLGVILAIATAVAVLGLLREPESDFKFGSSSYSQGYSVVLAGYDNWANFTDACCCAPAKLPLQVDGLNTTESWVCRNGRSVLRARMSSDGSSNGLPLRGLCEVTFTPNCTVARDDTTVKLQCGAGVVDELNLVYSNTVTAFAQAVLW